jgi:predicted nucleic acid-binding Zn ribbon protein
MPISCKEHSNKPSALGSEVGSILGEIKKARKAKYSFWTEAVGEKISEAAVPVYNKKGVLFVKVSDSVWRFELTRRKNEILEKVNENLSEKNKIKDILFK